MKLVIAEKPSVAREIAKILGAKQRREGYLEGNGYLVSWAVGHLVSLAEPDDYNPLWKKWNLNTLPIVPQTFQLKLIRKTAPQYKILANLLKQASEVINACDAGREGELIFRYIYKLSGIQLPMKRLWVSSLTEEALEKGFNNLKDGKEFDRLFYAAECRSKGDWLVGINATRAYTVKSDILLSIGRVQTPTLAMIVMREREIEGFDSKDYFEIMADFGTTNGNYRGKWHRGDEKSLDNLESAKEIVDKVKGKGIVTEVEKSEVKEKPPLLFDLTSLQKEANKRYGYTAAKTLSFAQNLYEAKLITYPRTDSKYLSGDMKSTFPKLLNALGTIGEYKEIVTGAKINFLSGPRVINDGKVTDHHAIIPTGKKPGAINKDEARIFDLIARRFLANTYSEAVYEQTVVITIVEGEHFETKGKVVLDQGWKAVISQEKNENVKSKKGKEKDDKEEEENQEIPQLEKGQEVIVLKAEALSKKTKPPKRYTEATLLTAMEKCGRDLPDELKDSITSGLGTPATRAGIIERLKQVEYISMEKKYLAPTEKGKMLIGILEVNQPELISPVLTGEWENKIEQVYKADYSPKLLLEEIVGFTEKIVHKAKEVKEQDMVFTSKTEYRCPLCNEELGSHGNNLFCNNSQCNFKTQIVVARKELPIKQIKAMLTEGRTGVIKGFKNKSGKTFSAALIMDKSGKIKFDFSQNEETKINQETKINKETKIEKETKLKSQDEELIPCPLCGGKIIEGKKGFGCSNWREKDGGCKFVIWKNHQGRMLNKTGVNNLIRSGYSDKLG